MHCESGSYNDQMCDILILSNLCSLFYKRMHICFLTIEKNTVVVTYLALNISCTYVELHKL